jgi:hypothetical protein
MPTTGTDTEYTAQGRQLPVFGAFLQLSPGVLLEELICSELPGISEELREKRDRGWKVDFISGKRLWVAFSFATERPLPPGIFTPSAVYPDIWDDVALAMKVELVVRGWEEPVLLRVVEIHHENAYEMRLVMLPAVRIDDVRLQALRVRRSDFHSLSFDFGRSRASFQADLF